MSFLLDTNICSAHLRNPAGLTHRMLQYSGRLFTSEIVVAELYAGAFHKALSGPLLTGIDDFLTDIRVLPFDRACALSFGQIRGEQLRRGISFSPIDLMIAATAFAHDLTVVTHNVKDFDKIPDLRIEDWL
ncbi:MAG: type II toxin-antitoxin system VapC family toxin [Pirellulales bacterium]|nr:type II toxin-antitoxin system VapC family toxin [Pirellulales bacterium]